MFPEIKLCCEKIELHFDFNFLSTKEASVRDY